ncbi:NUDIX domain-containing protein [Orbaceae bacterium ac157xtp]
MNQNVILISAGIVINENKQLLLVKKRGSAFYMQAGGKIESNETPVQALIRELYEEVELTTSSKQFDYVGEFVTIAANEKDHLLKAHLFTLQVENQAIKAKAEIKIADWYTLEEAKQLCLAPLTKEIILPIVENLFSK